MRYWKRIDRDGKTTTVEGYSHDLDVEGAIEIIEAEFDAYIVSLPVTKLEPVKDLFAEIDSLMMRVEVLEKK